MYFNVFFRKNIISKKAREIVEKVFKHEIKFCHLLLNSNINHHYLFKMPFIYLKQKLFMRFEEFGYVQRIICLWVDKKRSHANLTVIQGQTHVTEYPAEWNHFIFRFWENCGLGKTFPSLWQLLSSIGIGVNFNLFSAHQVPIQENKPEKKNAWVTNTTISASNYQKNLNLF